MQKDIRANSMQFTSTRLFSTQLSGDHVIKKSDIKIRWGAAYSNLFRDVPDLRRMYYSQNFGDTIYKAYVPYVASPSYAGKYFSWLDEKMYAGNADVTVPFKIRKQKQSFKVGGAVQLKERTF